MQNTVDVGQIGISWPCNGKHCRWSMRCCKNRMKKRSRCHRLYSGPGLVGGINGRCDYWSFISLCVGDSALGVHHMEGHLFSAYAWRSPQPEMLLNSHCWVSGGHTPVSPSWWVFAVKYRLFWGKSLDDAAGEAFDLRPPKWLVAVIAGGPRKLLH